jgi:lipoprotein-anchoring transpeptidase ErfK/SrfK
MEPRGKYESVILLMGVFAVAVAVVGLLALLGAWLVGSPAQAAASPVDPTPTVDSPPEMVQPTAVLPTATPSVPAPLPPAPKPTEVPPTPALAIIVAGTDGVNVRSGPGTDFTRVGTLSPGEEATVMGRFGDWWQIDYADAPAWVASWVVTAHNVAEVPQVAAPRADAPPNPAEGPLPVEADDIDEARWIDVDLSEQMLTAYEHGMVVHTTLVSTGLPQTPTPTGQFRIWIKLRYDDMAGADYYIEDVPYVMYFHEGYGLHGVTWHGNFGHPMSHGCVNLPTPEAEWLFNWADVGTLVSIRA